MTQFNGPDQDKYRQILKSQGLHAALTALHHEMWQLENECFEGQTGFQNELYEVLRQYRAYSAELYNMNQFEPDYPKPQS